MAPSHLNMAPTVSRWLHNTRTWLNNHPFEQYSLLLVQYLSIWDILLQYLVSLSIWTISPSTSNIESRCPNIHSLGSILAHHVSIMVHILPIGWHYHPKIIHYCLHLSPYWLITLQYWSIRPEYHPSVMYHLILSQCLHISQIPGILFNMAPKSLI